jgi:hypothetical protein
LQLRRQRSDQIGGIGIDGGIVRDEWSDRACSDNVFTTGHFSRNERSGLEPASKRSPLEKKTVNCCELETDRYGSGKILALYDEYVQELIAINDKKFGLIQDYADNWGKMTNEQSLLFYR